MISYKSIKNYFITNIFLFFIAYIEYIFNSSFFILLIRNYIVLYFIDYSTKNRNNISLRKYPIESYKYEFQYYFISSTLIDTITFYISKSYLLNNNNDLIYFIPISFLFEIIFDFFHYCMHRLVHINPYLYKNLHKIHHRYNHPTSIITFYQHPIDLILTNTIPTFITLLIIPMSLELFTLINVYKIYIEISGHSGKKVNSTSFPQFIWLPKYFNIELCVEDHDLHHTNNNCNYSKRFILWDKFFNTYKNIVKK